MKREANLIDDDAVKEPSIAGLNATGVQLTAQSAQTMKKLRLELAGNAPFPVLDNSFVNAAVRGVMVPKFRNAGQAYVCANRSTGN